MVRAFLVLLGLQWVGEVGARLTGLPVPGPVLAMAALVVILYWRQSVPGDVDRAARGLLDHLSLLFVPAGVGVIVHLQRLREAAVPIAAALVTSTLITIVVTAKVVERLSPREDPDS